MSSENEIDLEKVRKYFEEDYNYRDLDLRHEMEAEWNKYVSQVNPHREEIFKKINEGFKLIMEAIEMSSEEEFIRFAHLWDSGVIQKHCPEFASKMDYGWSSSSFSCM